MTFRVLKDVFYLVPALCCWNDDYGRFTVCIAFWCWSIECALGGHE